VTGLILAFPIMVTVKVVCDRVDELKPLGELLGAWAPAIPFARASTCCTCSPRRRRSNTIFFAATSSRP